MINQGREKRGAQHGRVCPSSPVRTRCAIISEHKMPTLVFSNGFLFSRQQAPSKNTARLWALRIFFRQKACTVSRRERLGSQPSATALASMQWHQTTRSFTPPCTMRMGHTLSPCKPSQFTVLGAAACVAGRQYGQTPPAVRPPQPECRPQAHGSPARRCPAMRKTRPQTGLPKTSTA